MPHETKQLLSKIFNMKDFEEASFVLNIEFHRYRSHSMFQLC